MHARASVGAQRAKIGNAALKTGFAKFRKLRGLLREFFPTCHGIHFSYISKTHSICGSGLTIPMNPVSVDPNFRV